MMQGFFYCNVRRRRYEMRKRSVEQERCSTDLSTVSKKTGALLRNIMKNILHVVIFFEAVNELADFVHLLFTQACGGVRNAL